MEEVSQRIFFSCQINRCIPITIFTSRCLCLSMKSSNASTTESMTTWRSLRPISNG